MKVYVYTIALSLFGMLSFSSVQATAVKCSKIKHAEAIAVKTNLNRTTKNLKRVLKTMTIKGTVIKKVVKTKKGITKNYYYLVKNDGKKVSLPKPKLKKKDKNKTVKKAIILDNYLNKKVVIVGLGSNIDKSGKKIDRIKKITSITVEEDKKEN